MRRALIKNYIVREKSAECLHLPGIEIFNKALNRFKIINTIFIVFAILLAIPVYILVRYDKMEETALIKYSSYNEVPTYLVFMSLGILIFAGSIGLFCSFFDQPYILDSYEGFLICVLGLNLVASLMASKFQVRIVKNEYQHFLDAELYHYKHHGKFEDVAKNGHLIDNIQSQFKCCGLSDGRDWIFSGFQAIPSSCCNIDKFKDECDSDKIGLHNKLDPKNYSKIKDEIFPMLWPDNCIDKVQERTSDRVIKWTALPLGFLLFQVGLMAYASHLADFLRLYGFSRMIPESRKIQRNIIKLKEEQVKVHLITDNEKT